MEKALMKWLAGASALAVCLLAVQLWAAPPIRQGPSNGKIDKIMTANFGGYPPYFKRPLQRIREGTASQKDMEKFIKACAELAKEKPLKGDLKEWQKMTAALLEAARKVKAGGDGKTEALKRLNTAANCVSCHEKFNPSYQKLKR
jgi:hypothetical protein